MTPVACFSRSFSKKFRAEPSIEEYSTKRKGAFPHRECANSSNDFWTLQDFEAMIPMKEQLELVEKYESLISELTTIEKQAALVRNRIASLMGGED